MYFLLAPQTAQPARICRVEHGLLLVGCWLLLPPFWLAACLGVAASRVYTPGRSPGAHPLQLHGLVYLACAAFAAGLFAYVAAVLAGTLPAAPTWIFCLVSACSMLASGLWALPRKGSACA